MVPFRNLSYHSPGNISFTTYPYTLVTFVVLTEFLNSNPGIITPQIKSFKRLRMGFAMCVRTRARGVSGASNVDGLRYDGLPRSSKYRRGSQTFGYLGSDV